MDTNLWRNISDFDLDQPLSAYSFSTRLAAENFWTINFAKEAIVEYKKFMYLAATSTAMVSPSPVVDVVWHEHLTFTQSYADFCQLLGKNIQHVPSTRSKVDAQRFQQARERTEKLYRETFGEPPGAVWKYEDMYAGLELPKAKIKVRTFLLIALLVFIVLITPAYFAAYPFFIHIDGSDFLTGYTLALFLTTFILGIINRSYLQGVFNRFDKNSFVRRLHPMELVYLKDRRVHYVVHDTVNQMMIAKKLFIKEEIPFVTEGATPGNPVEWAVMDVIQQNKSEALYLALSNKLAKMPVFTNVPNAMDALNKYFVKSKAFSRIFYLNTAVLMLLLLVGVVRMLMGIMRDKPVGMLAILLIVATLVVVLALYGLSHQMTKKIIPAFYKGSVTPTSAQPAVEWQYFLLGAAFLTPSMQPAVKHWRESAASSSSDFSSSSDSGSSCSSGCGSSCGGCGGGD